MQVVVIQHRNSGMKKQMPLDEWEEFQYTEAGRVYRKTNMSVDLYKKDAVKFIPPEADIKPIKLPKGAIVEAGKETKKKKSK